MSLTDVCHESFLSCNLVLQSSLIASGIPTTMTRTSPAPSPAAEEEEDEESSSSKKTSSHCWVSSPSEAGPPITSTSTASSTASDLPSCSLLLPVNGGTPTDSTRTATGIFGRTSSTGDHTSSRTVSSHFVCSSTSRITTSSTPPSTINSNQHQHADLASSHVRREAPEPPPPFASSSSTLLLLSSSSSTCAGSRKKRTRGHCMPENTAYESANKLPTTEHQAPSQDGGDHFTSSSKAPSTSCCFTCTGAPRPDGLTYPPRAPNHTCYRPPISNDNGHNQQVGCYFDICLTSSSQKRKPKQRRYSRRNSKVGRMFYDNDAATLLYFKTISQNFCLDHDDEREEELCEHITNKLESSMNIR